MQTLGTGIAAVWLVNGLYAKVLMQVPRHALIVERILHAQHASVLTRVIGLAEVAMAIWILSGRSRFLNAVVQCLVIGTMNILEFFLAPDLLLWGRLNILFAALFMVLVGIHARYQRPQTDRHQ